MSPESCLLWAAAMCLLGSGLWLWIFQRLWRMRTLVTAPAPLAAGPVELWGQLHVRDSTAPDRTALVHQQLKITEDLGEEDGLKLHMVSERCHTAVCELETPFGRLPIDLQHCRVSSTDRSYKEKTSDGLTFGAAWSPAPSEELLTGWRFNRTLVEQSVRDGEDVLVLGDAVSLTWDGRIPASPGFGLRGRSASPLLICQGSRRRLLGGDLCWLAMLGVLGAACLYLGVMMIKTLSTQPKSALFAQCAKVVRV